MADRSIDELIYEETEKRLQIMEDPAYRFPQQATKADAMMIGGLVGVSIVLVILCMVGVIV